MAEGKVQIDDIVEFTPGMPNKKDVFEGEHFKVTLVCIDSGMEIPVHFEAQGVYAVILSGKGIFTINDNKYEMEKGSMIYMPTGTRGIKAIEKLALLGIQEPH